MNDQEYVERKIVHTRHVLAVEAAYYKDKLSFDLDFTTPDGHRITFGQLI